MRRQLIDSFDAVLLTGGSEKPRDLPIPGRDLAGIHFAMDFLPQQNRRVAKESPLDNRPILAAGKHVVVIGGGDTGSDCIGTSNRQGALSVTQLEVMPKPPEKENKLLTWPNWPLKMRTSSSHQEGAERDFSVMTKSFSGENGEVKTLHCVRVDGAMKEIPGSEFELKADLVLLAMGFVHPVHEGLLKSLGVKLDPRGNVDANVNELQAPASTRSSRPATCAAASRWSSGPSARAARPPAPSMNISWARRSCRDDAAGGGPVPRRDARNPACPAFQQCRIVADARRSA